MKLSSFKELENFRNAFAAEYEKSKPIQGQVKSKAIQESKESKIEEPIKPRFNDEIEERLKRLEEIEKLDEYDDSDFDVQRVLPEDKQGRIYLVYSSCNDGSIGIKRDYATFIHQRIPHINHKEYLRKVAKGSILVMSKKSYESFQLFGDFDVPGIQLVILTKDKRFDAKDAVIIHSLKELRNNINAAKALGTDIFINAGPTLLNEFLNDAKGEYVLFTSNTAGDYRHHKDKVIYFTHKRKFNKNSKHLVYREPVPRISRSEVTITYREFE